MNSVSLPTDHVSRAFHANTLSGQVRCPVVHEPTAALEQVRAPIGRLDPVLYHMREGCLNNLARMIRLLGRPVRKLERKPWGTATIPCFRNIRRSCFSSSCLPTRLGNRNGLVPSTSDRASSRISTARPHSGTRCSRFALESTFNTLSNNPGLHQRSPHTMIRALAPTKETKGDAYSWAM